MRSVRCDVCGTKALLAASQCPKCGHLFEVRDGFGDLVPLAHCQSCDSFYPVQVGECKWCGTIPEPVRKISFPALPWKHIGFGGLVAVAWVGWLVRAPHGTTAARSRAASHSAAGRSMVRDTTATPVTAGDTAAPAITADTASPHDSVLIATAPEPVNAPAMPAPVAVPDHPVILEARPRSAGTAVKARVARRPTSWVARNWIVVRADARPGARIVASIGPESRLQLGEARGSWRHVRSRDIAGWADMSRASLAPVHRSLRGAGLASR